MEALEQLGGYSCGGIVGNGSFGPPFTPWPQNSCQRKRGGFGNLKNVHLELFLHRTEPPYDERESLGRKLWIFNHVCLLQTCFATNAAVKSNESNEARFSPRVCLMHWSISHYWYERMLYRVQQWNTYFIMKHNLSGEQNSLSPIPSAIIMPVRKPGARSHPSCVLGTAFCDSFTVLYKKYFILGKKYSCLT